MNGSIHVRPCTTGGDFDACTRLQRDVWGQDHERRVPRAMCVVAMHVGGQVLGAFDGPSMVGLAIAYPGIREGRAFLYSYCLAVLSGYQERGIDRALRLAQRENAIARGVELMEWNLDRSEPSNARSFAPH